MATNPPKSSGFVVARYVLVLALVPSAVFAGVFAILCAMDCVVLPWFTFAAAPVITLAIVVPFGVITYRRSSTYPESERSTIRIVVLSSIFWAPVLSGMIFGLLLTSLQFIR